MVPTFAITSIGAVARRVLRDGASGHVSAAFGASIHLEFPDGIACLVASDLGNGPLNALVECGAGHAWQPDGIEPQMPAHVVAGVLAVGGSAAFPLVAAQAWVPPPWPAVWQPRAVREALQRLAAEAAPRLPGEGLALTVFGEPQVSGIAAAVARRALLSTATVSDWLAVALEPAAMPEAELTGAARAAVHALVGLGPGLTPSGDDVLAGLLVALHAAGAGEAAAALAAFVAEAPEPSTTSLSRACLAAAADGHASETMAVLIQAVLAATPESFTMHLDRIDAIGHTSGWDMLAGVALGLSAVAAARLAPAT